MLKKDANKKKNNKKINIKSKMKLMLKNKKMIIIFIAILVLIATITAAITIPQIISKIQAEKNSLLSYEVIRQVDEGKYKILITVKSDSGIEYIKLPDGDTLKVTDQRTKVGIDYTVLDEVKYDFVIKQVGKDEVTESIYKEVQKIQGDYILVNGVYSNKPDLTGYTPEYTRYLNEDSQGNMIPGNWITDEPNCSEWYNYKESKWANIYSEVNGQENYYVWIPRYCFKLDQDAQRSDVKFIDTSNNYKDENGNITTWAELSQEGYQIPEAFRYNGYRIPGYWSMKYTVGDVTGTSTINYDMSVYKGVMTIRNIVLNTSITGSNPITKYTVALNGKIIKTIEDSTTVANINSQVIELNDMINGDNMINVTALNAQGEIVGSMTKKYSPAVVNAPDLSSFNKDTTFYVTYDGDGKEHSTVPISQDVPNDWYEYGESRWANIVTRNNGVEVYYTWIPRYQFILDQTNQRSTVKFINGTGRQADSGYQIPDAFWFDKNSNGKEDDGEQLTGYWAMKYTLGEETAPVFDTEVVATSSSIRTKGITGTSVGSGQVYNYYINGEFKGKKTNASDTFEYTGLKSNTKYTILVEIRNSSTDEYIGTVSKQISTIDANRPELAGFKSEKTYYVLYDNNGNETIGDRIDNNGNNMPSNWYNYAESRWANIVVTDGTVSNGKITGATATTYYTWIPRYEFRLTDAQQAQSASARSEVRFISGTSKDTDNGYQIPDAFWFDKNSDGKENDGEQLTGYWVMKYTAGE